MTDHPPGAPIQYSGAYRGITRVAGRTVGGPRGYAVDSSRPARIPVQTRAPAAPCIRVAGRALVYGQRIPSRTGADLFTAATEWMLDEDTVGLRLNHAALIGSAHIKDDGVGLWAVGTMRGEWSERTRGMSNFSIGWAPIDNSTGPDGVTVHHRVKLTEVSLTDRPLSPGTLAAVYR